MKHLFLAIVLMLLFMASAAQIDPAYDSQFKTLDPTDSKFLENKAALCVKLLQSIKKETFAAARLQEQVDKAALLKTTVTPEHRDQLKKLYAALRSENNDYAQNCTE